MVPFETPHVPPRRARFVVATLILAIVATASTGCAVVSVASTAVGVTAGAVGLAADAAVGTVKLTGKAVGAAAGAVIPGGSAPSD